MIAAPCSSVTASPRDLGTRSLLDQQKLTAAEIGPRRLSTNVIWIGKEDLAIQVLMQAVVAARVVTQQQRRRLDLTGAPANLQKTFEVRRIQFVAAHRMAPSVGDPREMRVDRSPYRGDQRRQRRGEILVLADAEAHPFHHDPRTKALALVVYRRKLGALRGVQATSESWRSRARRASARIASHCSAFSRRSNSAASADGAAPGNLTASFVLAATFVLPTSASSCRIYC